MMEGLLADVVHAFRVYRRTPISSAASVVVLAIAMAFVAAFFSLYVDLLVRPHPGFEPGGRLITFGWNTGQNAGGLRYELIERIANESTTIEAAAGVSFGSVEIGQDREQVIGEMVTRHFFSGVRPRIALGHGLDESAHEPGSEPVAVISHDLWLQRFGGSPDVLGQTIEVVNRALPTTTRVENGQMVRNEPSAIDYRIVGVMSPHFTGITPLEQSQKTSVWIAAEPAFATLGESGQTQLLNRTKRGIGRRASNVSPSAIAGELTSRFGEELEASVPLAGVRFDVLDGLVFNAVVHRDTERHLQLFIVASILLAVVAAANISLFLLARAPGRRREIGIRMSVGATLQRIRQQLGTEAALLVAAASTLGVAISIWLAEFLRTLSFMRRAQWRDVALFDWRVLSLIGAFLLILTVLVAMAPISGLKRLGIAGSSRQVAARATPAQRVAGTAQIAVAGMLGGAGVAFAWYLGALILQSPGYETRNLHVMRYSTQSSIINQVNANPGSAPANLPELIAVEESRRRDAVLSVPGVTDVSFSGAGPGVPATGFLTVPHPDNPGDQIAIQVASIDTRFIDLLGLELVHGRALHDGETGVLVNQALAQRLFGREDIVGDPLVLVPFVGNVEVMGVLKDISFAHPSAEVSPTVFSPSPLSSLGGLALIQSSSTPAQLRRQIDSMVESGALEFTINDIRSVRDVRMELIASDRARSLLTIGTATLVVVLAAFGFYGTQRYLVTAGRREYAIRASLGAGPRVLGQLVVRRGLRLGVPGLVLGALLAYITVAWLRDDFVSRDVSPGWSTAAVVTGLALIMLLASVGPARHARQTQPAPLLRED